MSKYYKASALVLALVAAGAVQAAQSLKVTIAEPADSTAKQTGEVEVTLKNDGDEPVDILKVLSPFAQIPTGGLAGDIFSIKDSRGHRVPYRGDSGKYLNFTTDDFVHLLPGQSISKTVDLAKDYALSNGPYTVGYDVDYSTKRPEPGKTVKDAFNSTNSTPRKHSISNTLQIWVNGSLLLARQKSTAGLFKASPVSPLVVSTTSCSSNTGPEGQFSPASQVATALTNAQNNAGDVWSTWVNFHFVADSTGAEFVPDARFTYWFGAQSQSLSWNQLWDDADADAADGDTVTDDEMPIVEMDAINTIVSGVDNDFSLVCDPCTGYPSSTVAHTTSSTATTYLCPTFFTLGATGTDSQWGTLIHEASHIPWDYYAAPGVYTTFGPTADYGYGQTAAANLATSDVHEARYNADNYEYFYENNPSLQ